MNKRLMRLVSIGCLGLLAFSHAAVAAQALTGSPELQVPVVVPEYSQGNVILAGRRVQFQVSMWRNLMPPIETSLPSPTINVWISANGVTSKGLPPGFEITGVRIWRAKKVLWTGEVNRQGVSDTPSFISRNARAEFPVATGRRVNVTVLYTIGKKRGSVTIANVPVGAAY